MKLSEVLSQDELKAIPVEQVELIDSKIANLVKDDPDKIPKYRFDQVNEQKNQLKQDADNLSKELAKLKKSAGENEELTSKIQALQDDIKSKETEYKNKESEITKKFALREALRESQAKHPDLLEGKFDLNELELTSEGKIKDFDTKLTPLIEQYKDLFGEVKRVGSSPNTDGKNPKPTNEVEKLKEQLKTAQENYRTAEVVSLQRQITEAEKGE